MSERFFIGVAHKRQVEIARAGGFVAFSHGREAAVRTLQVGDRVVFYAPKSDFDGTPVQAFVAHATVTGDAPFERDFAGHGTGWAREAAFDEVTEAAVRPLRERLDFVRKRLPNWGMAFRQGKFRIDAADYRVLVSELGLD